MNLPCRLHPLFRSVSHRLTPLTSSPSSFPTLPSLRRRFAFPPIFPCPPPLLRPSPPCPGSSAFIIPCGAASDLLSLAATSAAAAAKALAHTQEGPPAVVSTRSSTDHLFFPSSFLSSLNALTSHFVSQLPISPPSTHFGVLQQYRSLWTFRSELRRRQWKFLRQEMVEYFHHRSPARDSTVELRAEPWPRFASKLDISETNRIPAVISRYGVERRICIERDELEAVAFDEPNGHLSLLFCSRLFRIHVNGLIEECIVRHVQADPVEKHIYFLKFARHVPGKLTEIELPVSMVGMLACPAFIQGYHVELAMPTVKLEVVGDTIPPPLQVDVSRLKYSAPYAAITLQDIKHLLPADGTARFHRNYILQTQEVVWTYEVGTLPEQPLPADYVDPNFLDKKGRRISLTYKNYFPKQ